MRKTFKLLNILAFSAITITGLNSPALAENVSVTIETLGDQMMFNKKEVTVKENSDVTVVFKNKSTSLKHNWLLVTPGTSDKVAMEAISVGESKGYIPKGNKNILAFTKLIDPGKSGTVKFKAPQKGSYDFVCTSPGHNMLMKGKFIVK